MFTGLVRAIGTLASRTDRGASQVLGFAAELAPGDRVLGASVAIDGVCLTVIDSDATTFHVEAAFETLRKTTLGRRPLGARVNLEPALRVGDALGGHLVSGHVDGVGRVLRVLPQGAARQVWYACPSDVLPLVAAKGSICIDGTSLTVNEVDRSGFSVGLVPHTLSATTLGDHAPGDEVNLEVDVIARYVARLLAAGPDPEARLRAAVLEPAYPDGEER